LTWMKFFTISYIFHQSAFLLGFTLYIYVVAYIREEFRFKKWFIVPIGVAIIAMTYYSVIVIAPDAIPRFLRDYALAMAESCINLVFFVLTGIVFIRYCLAGERPVSKRKVIWLLFLISGIVDIWLLRLMFFFVWDVSSSYRMSMLTLDTYFFLSFLFFNTIFFFALRKPVSMDRRKYESSLLASSDKERYAELIRAFMNENRPYLDPSLTLKKLADKMNLPHHHVSQVLNEGFKKNFFDFINSYRIEESKRIMQEDKKKTIIEILFSVGFNSKSTFNSAFRKHTGMAPKEYRKKFSP
ncbi:MAG TPA: AraC family transcriptional regulator, partial [Spirochaetota bacterium]